MPQKLSHDSRRWLALALLCAAETMVVVDLAIVNVALPAIQEALGFSRADLQWVVIGYTLAFGGFLLLGGRLADLLGRRRVFLAGLALFTLASLACGLAGTPAALIAARAAQGLGGALLSPAALSIIGTLFREGAERNKALGIWGGVAGASGAAGVLIGGVVTDAWGWEWIFLINIPVGIAAFALAFPLLPTDGRVNLRGRFDVPGAVLITGGVGAIVFGLARTEANGWLHIETYVALSGGLVMLLLFIAIERVAPDPLMPLEMFRRATLVGANFSGLLLGAAFFSTFFFMSLYMQQVLGYSASKAGLAYLPLALIVVVAAVVSQDLVGRIGARTVLTAGLLLVAVGIGWFIQIDADERYLTGLLPGFIVGGIGFGMSFVPVSITALHRVSEREVGAASGLINSAQEIGGALGIAVLVSVAASWTGTVLAPGDLVPGFRAAFAGAAVLALLGAIVAVTLVAGDAGRSAETPGPGSPHRMNGHVRVPVAAGPMGDLNPYPAYALVEHDDVETSYIAAPEP